MTARRRPPNTARRPATLPWPTSAALLPVGNSHRLPCVAEPELWYSHAVDDRQVARGLCATCPLIEPCRQAGREGREFGVWGGEDESDRDGLGLAPPYWKSPKGHTRRPQDPARQLRRPVEV